MEWSASKSEKIARINTIIKKKRQVENYIFFAASVRHSPSSLSLSVFLFSHILRTISPTTTTTTSPFYTPRKRDERESGGGRSGRGRRFVAAKWEIKKKIALKLKAATVRVSLSMARHSRCGRWERHDLFVFERSSSHRGEGVRT